MLKQTQGCPRKTTFQSNIYLPKLQQEQDTPLRELKMLQSKQQSVEEKLGILLTRIDCFEANLASLNKLQTDVDDISLLASRLMSQIKHLEEHQDNQGNQSSRSNLIFFSVQDAQSKTWAETETKVINICKDKLEITV